MNFAKTCSLKSIFQNSMKKNHKKILITIFKVINMILESTALTHTLKDFYLVYIRIPLRMK